MLYCHGATEVLWIKVERRWTEKISKGFFFLRNISKLYIKILWTFCTLNNGELPLSFDSAYTRQKEDLDCLRPCQCSMPEVCILSEAWYKCQCLWRRQLVWPRAKLVNLLWGPEPSAALASKITWMLMSSQGNAGCVYETWKSTYLLYQLVVLWEHWIEGALAVWLPRRRLDRHVI